MKNSTEMEKKTKNVFVKCEDCAHHYGEAQNYMVYCKRLGVMRCVSDRICTLFQKLSTTKNKTK